MKVCYERGPTLGAIFEAAPMDERLEKAWRAFVTVFYDTVTTRIEKDQAAGLAPSFEAHPVAIAINRMDIGILIHHFGRRPRSQLDETTRQGICRFFYSTSLLLVKPKHEGVNNEKY